MVLFSPSAGFPVIREFAIFADGNLGVVQEKRKLLVILREREKNLPWSSRD